MRSTSDRSVLFEVAFAFGVGVLAVGDILLAWIVGPSFCENRVSYAYCNDLSSRGRVLVTLIPLIVLLISVVVRHWNEMACRIGLVINLVLLVIAIEYF